MIRVLFVCLGNICRSPVAAAIFRKRVKEKGLEIEFVADSAGTSAYHIGEPPDQRSVQNAHDDDDPSTILTALPEVQITSQRALTPAEQLM